MIWLQFQSYKRRGHSSEKGSRRLVLVLRFNTSYSISFSFILLFLFETFGYERDKNSTLKHVFFGIESLVFFSIPFFSMKVTVPLIFHSHNFIPIPFISSAATYYFY